jgi:hypothetical protein
MIILRMALQLLQKLYCLSCYVYTYIILSFEKGTSNHAGYSVRAKFILQDVSCNILLVRH